MTKTEIARLRVGVALAMLPAVAVIAFGYVACRLLIS